MGLSDIMNSNGKKTEFNTLVVDSSSEEEQMDSTENSREARESVKKYDELSMDSSEFLNIDEDNVGLEELIKQKAALQACLGAYMSDEEDDSEDDSEDDDEDEDEGEEDEEDEEKEIDEDDDIVEMKRVTSSRSKVDRRRQEAGAADKGKNGNQVTDVVTIEDSDEDDINKKDKDKERKESGHRRERSRERSRSKMEDERRKERERRE